jgi:large subunit ribosomal protein L10e
MGLRPGHCYSKNIGKRAYTRVAKRVHKKNFVGGVPGLKIRQFHMGFGQREYTHVIHYIVSSSVQIRDNAIEAARMSVVRQLNKKLTQQNYYLKVRVYPQFFLRENKQAQGAHADRIQQGMSQCPFGKVVGRASRVRPNQKIFSILCDEQYIPIVRELLKKANSKFPCTMKIIVEKNLDSIKSVGTTKKRRRLQKADTEKVEKTEEKEKSEVKGKKTDTKKTDTKKTDTKKTDTKKTDTKKTDTKKNEKKK